ncbi:hypothetical protein BGX28_003030 [Mortierella sp. GBA30]|nr:hypothetical protein BGX28_003030 [Mortierella sp. GBA30]
MKAVSTLAVLGAIASAATAFVNPTDPWSTSVWKPNTQVNITWTDDGKAPTLKTSPKVNIYFMTGSDLVQTQLAVIAENYDAFANSHILYNVPVVDPPGQIYFLKFTSATSADMAFTTRFTVTDVNNNPGTLKPTGDATHPNPGGNGTIVAPGTGAGAGATSTTATPATGTASGSASAPSGTSTGAPKNGAGSVGASALSVAAAAVLGAVALVAF